MTLGYVARKALSLGVAARTIMLAVYVGIFAGFIMGLAWAYMLKFATPHALDLIARVQG